MPKLTAKTRLTERRKQPDKKLDLKLKSKSKRQQMTVRFLPVSIKRLDALVKAMKSNANLHVSRTDIIEALVRDAVNNIDVEQAQEMITEFMVDDRGKTDI